MIVFISVLFILISGFLGFQMVKWLSLTASPLMGIALGLLAGALVVGLVELILKKISLGSILAGLSGLVVGLIVANILSYLVLLIPVSEPYSRIIPIVMILFFSYLGVILSIKKVPEIDIMDIFGKVEIGSRYKILDTSVIIDGRIADVCETGFLEGTLVIPRFVLRELQYIADSSDPLKRNRGRRGLDILNKIQKRVNIKVWIHEAEFPEIREVDGKLIRLAKKLKAKVLTNDFNLNKIAELEGVTVLNINDLANAVKPVVLPGEIMSVRVIKDGKEPGQGVGYLDDGTMVVVDGGKDYLGRTIDVLVTSVLQTTAGRMIFTRLKGEEE